MRSQIQQWYSKMNVTTGFSSSNWSRNRLERLSNCRFQLYSVERKGAGGTFQPQLDTRSKPQSPEVYFLGVYRMTVQSLFLHVMTVAIVSAPNVTSHSDGTSHLDATSHRDAMSHPDVMSHLDATLNPDMISHTISLSRYPFIASIELYVMYESNIHIFCRH